jgi:8-oxo-dGTP pyrophosphatase MutT (NUDIX family)
MCQRERLPLIKFKKDMKYTYVGVTLVRSDGAVLAQHRDNIPTIPEPDRWGICGGKKEPYDEDDQHAGARELREETGYQIKPELLHYLGGDDFYVGRDHIVRKFYWAPYDGVQPIYSHEGYMRFVEVSELASLNFCESSHALYLQKASEKLYTPMLERVHV